MAMHSPRTVVRTALIGITATLALSACSGQEKEQITATPTPAVTTSSASATVLPSTAASTPAKAPITTTSSTATKPTTKPTTSRVLTGTRQVAIVPVPSFESALALDPNGRLNLTDAEGGLFVFTPVGTQHLIRTATADPDTGESSCLTIQVNGSNPLTAVATACDAADADQLFTVTAKGTNYVISNQAAVLQVVDGELIAKELGDAPLTTTFKLVDNGKANLPSLD